MSLACPRCGCEIVGLIPGADPLPGWRNLDANGRNLAPQIPAQIDGANPEIAHGSKGSKTKGQTYNQGYPGEFLEFWKIYPRKRDKRKALGAWRNAIRRKSPDAILAGAIRYRDDPNRLDQFTKYAEGWLNGDGWEDEPLPTRLAPGIIPTPVRQSPEEIAAEIAALGAEVE